MIIIEMENGGVMKFELDEENAPLTCANFIKLVSEHFYDGLIFHRVIENFMIQGGDPEGTGFGGSKETIKGEFLNNGVPNYHKHTRGTISMARSRSFDSASSQFFICHTNTPHLDKDYAAFGQMTEGFEVLDQIACTPTDRYDRPKTQQKIRKITIQ